jgi:D-alanine-D-alanine ligase
LLENKVSTPNHILPENLEDGTTIKFPVIIKSNKDHGSFWMSGDSIVNSKEVLKNRFNKFSQETGRDFMAEEFIDGPEFTLGVWGNKNPESLSVLELQFPKGRKNTSKIYSYNCKWNKNSFYFKNTGIVHATNIAKTLEKRIKSEALKAYKALDCCGFARIDVRVHNGVPYVIDVNLNPYLGPDSEFLMSSNYHGFNNGETVIKLCDYALEKFEHLI